MEEQPESLLTYLPHDLINDIIIENENTDVESPLVNIKRNEKHQVLTCPNRSKTSTCRQMFTCSYNSIESSTTTIQLTKQKKRNLPTRAELGSGTARTKVSLGISPVF